MFFDEYFPMKENACLSNVGNVAAAREDYYENKPPNLVFLLKKRYGWMNEFIGQGEKVLEVGCGMGVSRDFIRKDADLMITDIEENPWVDKAVNALDTGFPAQSFDVVICSNMVHHLAFPKKFFSEMGRILKPGGRLLIQEISCSLMCQVMLRLLRLEGWSFKRDPFSEIEPSNDKDDPWSGNNAIPDLLFNDIGKFEKNIHMFKIKSHKFSEFFIFPLSGGVTAKARTIHLPHAVLGAVDRLDGILTSLAPQLFALQRGVVLVKK